MVLTRLLCLISNSSFQVGIDRSSIAGNAQVSYTVAAAGLQNQSDIAKNSKYQYQT